MFLGFSTFTFRSQLRQPCYLNYWTPYDPSGGRMLRKAHLVQRIFSGDCGIKIASVWCKWSAYVCSLFTFLVETYFFSTSLYMPFRPKSWYQHLQKSASHLAPFRHASERYLRCNSKNTVRQSSTIVNKCGSHDQTTFLRQLHPGNYQVKLQLGNYWRTLWLSLFCNNHLTLYFYCTDLSCQL